MMTSLPRFLLLFLLLGALCLGFQATSLVPGSNNSGDSLAHASTSAPQTETPSDAAPHHGDPYARVFLVLALLLICAMAGHFIARKLNQSAVLGELAVGILVGALAYQLSGPMVTILRHSDQVAAATQKVLQQNVGWQEAVRLTLAEAKLSAGGKSADPNSCCQPPISPIFAGGQDSPLFFELRGGPALVYGGAGVHH